MKVATLNSSTPNFIYVHFSPEDGLKEEYIELMEELSLAILLKSLKEKVVIIYDGSNSGFVSWENNKAMMDFQYEKKDIFNDKVVAYAVVIPNLVGRIIYSIVSKFVDKQFKMEPFESISAAEAWGKSIMTGIKKKLTVSSGPIES